MRIVLIVLMAFLFIGCSTLGSSGGEDDVPESTKEAIKEVSETEDAAVEDIKPVKRCDVKLNRSLVNFGSPKITSRAFRRLRLKSSTTFTLTSVSTIAKPFGYYNSGEFPGEATYHDYELCDMSSASKDCSINLEFRPRAVESYEENLIINYMSKKWK